MQLDLESVREVFARLVDHHVPARDQEQPVVALEEEATGVGQLLVALEGLNPKLGRGRQARRLRETAAELASSPEISLQTDLGPLDVAAAWTTDRTEITLAIVNPASEPKTVAFSLNGAAPAADANRWVITGPDRWAHNDPDRPRQVDIASGTVNIASGKTTVAPLSVTLLAIPVRQGG